MGRSHQMQEASPAVRHARARASDLGSTRLRAGNEVVALTKRATSQLTGPNEHCCQGTRLTVELFSPAAAGMRSGEALRVDQSATGWLRSRYRQTPNVKYLEQRFVPEERRQTMTSPSSLENDKTAYKANNCLMEMFTCHMVKQVPHYEPTHLTWQAVEKVASPGRPQMATWA